MRILRILVNEKVLNSICIGAKSNCKDKVDQRQSFVKIALLPFNFELPCLSNPLQTQDMGHDLVSIPLMWAL